MEWKILRGPDSEMQKKLNQWKHMYNISIYGITNCSQNYEVIILLTRTKKEN